MSFQEFPNYLYEIVNTGGTTSVGTFTSNSYKQISAVTLPMIFYQTSLFTNQRVRISMTRSSQADTIVSSWFNPKTAIADFLDSDHWIGFIRFDFARQNIQDGDVLGVSIETENYTHSIGGTEIGAISNFLDDVTGEFDVDIKASYVNIFGYE